MVNVVTVLSKMRRRWIERDTLAPNLSDQLGVPSSKQDEIIRHHGTLQDQHAALAQYLLYSLPGFSWAIFAGALYYLEEGAALQEARRYINREEGELLCVVVIDVHNSIKTNRLCDVCIPVTSTHACGMRYGRICLLS